MVFDDLAEDLRGQDLFVDLGVPEFLLLAVFFVVQVAPLAGFLLEELVAGGCGFCCGLLPCLAHHLVYYKFNIKLEGIFEGKEKRGNGGEVGNEGKTSIGGWREGIYLKIRKIRKTPIPSSEISNHSLQNLTKVILSFGNIRMLFMVYGMETECL